MPYNCVRNICNIRKLTDFSSNYFTGIKRPNQPMHAVLESSMDDLQNGMEDEAQKVRNHALIHYLASLASSNSEEDTFDFDFVESLIVNGANINSTDKSGQTIFHEVARSWNLDVASFLIEHGKMLLYIDNI